MQLELGKYYRFAGENSFVVGPMESYDGHLYKANGEIFDSVRGKSYYGDNYLVEEVTVPEGVPFTEFFEGMCVKTLKGVITWVTQVNRWREVTLRSYENETFTSDPYKLTHIPEWDIKATPVDISKFLVVGDRALKNCRINYRAGTAEGLMSSYPTNIYTTYTGSCVSTGELVQFKPEDITSVHDTNPLQPVRPVDLNLSGKYVTMHQVGVSGKPLNETLWVRVQAEGLYWVFSDFRNARTIYSPETHYGWSFNSTEELSVGDPVIDSFDISQHDPFLDMEELSKTFYRMIPDKDLAEKFRIRCSLSGLRQATQNRSNLALYLDQKQKDAKRIQSLRPGRAIRAMLPEATDALIEQMVDTFRKNFPTNEYVVKRGFEAKDFKHMYAHTMMSMQNPRTTTARKSLGNSCMRHASNFERLPHHPAEAYASGEFEAIWSENTDGRIGSRLVVWHPPEGHRLHGKPQCGPVYGTCEYSIDLLEEVAKGMGADLYDDATWSGAKWQKLPYEGGVIAPYSDHEQYIEDCGNYLKVGGDCDYEASDYSGVLGNKEDDGFDCDECGTYIDPDSDDYYHTGHHGCICSSCRDRYYFYCEDYEEDRPRDEMCEVYRISLWGREARYVCEAARDENYTYCVDDGEHWDNDDVTLLANGDAISPAGRDSGDYAECTVSEEWYPITEMYPLVEGGYIARVNFDETTHARNDLGEVYEREAA